MRPKGILLSRQFESVLRARPIRGRRMGATCQYRLRRPSRQDRLGSPLFVQRMILTTVTFFAEVLLSGALAVALAGFLSAQHHHE